MCGYGYGWQCLYCLTAESSNLELTPLWDQVDVEKPRKLNASKLRNLSRFIVPIISNFRKFCYRSKSKYQVITFITARRYAKRGICRRRVSVCVCLCVCHTPVLYQIG